MLLKEKSIDLNDDSWKHFDGDILDIEKLEKVIGLCKPDVVIHMAAQAIVRTSYAKPIDLGNKFKWYFKSIKCTKD